MKHITKILFVILATITFSTANAGELSVSGTAKATYNIHSGLADKGKGIGITNELNFTAAGELDNGYTWSYSMELDPGATSPATETSTGDTQSAQNDDTKLTLTTPYGTVGVFISEGGSTTRYLIKGVSVPASSSIEVVQGGSKIVLQDTDVLKAQAGTADAFDCWLSRVDTISS